MSNYGSNKVATAVLMDVSRGMSLLSSDGQTHLERSKRILSRILLRKMFAYETDEVGILTVGPEGTETVSPLQIPTWDMCEKVEELSSATSPTGGNWAQGMVDAVRFLDEECQGKKFKSKQLVVLSNFTWSSPSIHARLQPLIHFVEGNKLEVLVVGLDIKQESQDQNETLTGVGELVQFVNDLETGMILSYEEIEDKVKLYAKKKRAARLTKSAMKIGSEITLPFKWMKVNNDDNRLKFEFPQRAFEWADASRGGLKRAEPTDVNLPPKKLKGGDAENGETTIDDPFPIDACDLKFEQDEYRKTRFGATEVLLSFADIEAMKMQTGPPSMSFLGTVKSSRITRAMIMSPVVYIMVSDGTKRSQAQLSALITALLKANKYGLARRIASSNGKPKIGILYPVSDELGKALYFLQLPLAEWVNTVPFRPLPDIVEPDLDAMMGELIDAMSIKGQGKELLSIDPNFQLRSFRIESRATNSQFADHIPDIVQNILHPFPEQEAAGETIVKKIIAAFEIPPPPSLIEPEPKDVSGPLATLKKELTEAEKEDIKAIEEMAMEGEWGKDL